MPKGRKHFDSRKGAYPLVWDPNEVPIDKKAFKDTIQPKNVYSAEWTRAQTENERHLLRVFDVSGPLFRPKRLDFIGATLARDLCGFGFRKDPHDVALEAAGLKAKKGADAQLQRIFQYGHDFEAVAKVYHVKMTGFKVENTGFWANPAYEGTGDRDEWFAKHWPFLFQRHTAEHHSLPEDIRDLTMPLYEERRDALLDAHYLVTTPDAIIDTKEYFDSDPGTSDQWAKLHDPEVYGYLGVGECKSHIHNIYNAQFNTGALVQMAAQSICTMQDEEYETGCTIPWGNLISSSCVTPLSRFWTLPKSRPLYKLSAWRIAFTGHSLMFEIMEEMRRFKETVDTMHGMTLAEYNAEHERFVVDRVFTMSDIEIDHMYDVQTEDDPTIVT